jgi:nucleoside-diphosphate-sugar epimerase
MTEDSPVNPSSEKGKVRRQIAELMMDEIKQGKLQGLIARSADFYGPHNEKSVLQELAYKNLKKGKRPGWMIDADKIHSFTYTPDAAKAVAILGNTPDAFNQVWHMPTSAEKLTARQVIELFNKEMGTSKKVQVMPMWLLKVLGIFIPILKEMPEMMYQNDRDYFFDSSKFNQRFSFTPTSYQQGVKQVVVAG